MAGIDKCLGILRRSLACNGRRVFGSKFCLATASSLQENRSLSLRTIKNSRQETVNLCPGNACTSGSFRDLICSRPYSTVVSKSPSACKPKAVIFDLGGVVVPSPQGIFDNFEEKWGLRAGSLVDTIKATGNGGSFAKMERGEYSVEEFCEPFKLEYDLFTGSTIVLDQVKEFAYALSDFTKCIPHEEVVEMFGWLKERGIKVAILTNNFRRDDGQTTFPNELEHVDVVCVSF